MDYFILLIILLLFIDIYYRLKGQRRIDTLVLYLTSVINHYERLFLKKKLMQEDDVKESRIMFANISRENYPNALSKENLIYLHKIIAVHNPGYTDMVSEIIKRGFKTQKGSRVVKKLNSLLIKELDEALYMHDDNKLKEIQKIVNNEDGTS